MQETPAYLMLAVLSAIFLSGCAQQPTPMFLAGNGDEKFAREEAQLISKAKMGDATSAYRLGSGYAVYRRDHENADYWLRRAAELSRSEAQETLLE